MNRARRRSRDILPSETTSWRARIWRVSMRSKNADARNFIRSIPMHTPTARAGGSAGSRPMHCQQPGLSASARGCRIGNTGRGADVCSPKEDYQMAAKRELIDTGTDKRYVRRNAKGQFKESDDVGRSLAADRRQKAKAVAKPGQGD